MFKVALRQMRFTFLFTLALLGIFLITAILTGMHMNAFYRNHVANCSLGNTSNICAHAIILYVNSFSFLRHLFTFLAYVFPALIGLFIGAPLFSGEFEKKTYKFAFTQSISRNKWFVYKFLAGLIFVILLSTIVSVTISWWFANIDLINQDKLNMAVFDIRYLAPVGYSIFGFSLGAFIGLLMRRQLISTALTLMVFVPIRIVVYLFVIGHLISPVVSTFPISPGKVSVVDLSFNSFDSRIFNISFGMPNIHNAWIYSVVAENSSGNRLGTSFLENRCQVLIRNSSPKDLSKPPRGIKGFHKVGIYPDLPVGSNRCITTIGKYYKLKVTYQPSSRFWPLQLADFMLYLVMSALLLLVGLFRVRRN